MGQVNLLKAEALNADPKDYFDEKRSMYDIVPVFPFIEEETIRTQIAASIDTKAFKKEVAEICAIAKEKNSIIQDTKYVISLVAWNDYPELIRLLTIIREWAFRQVIQ